MPRSLPHDVELCLFRIVQEGLNNVVKHSGAREALVILAGTGKTITVSIADTGQGFEPSSVAGGAGLGLAGMRERLRTLGGDLTIKSQAGQGTTISARVPLAQLVDENASAGKVRVA